MTPAYQPPHLNTILAALTFYRDHGQTNPLYRTSEIQALATDNNQTHSLDYDEIADLITRLKAGPIVECLNLGAIVIAPDLRTRTATVSLDTAQVYVDAHDNTFLHEATGAAATPLEDVPGWGTIQAFNNPEIARAFLKGVVMFADTSKLQHHTAHQADGSSFVLVVNTDGEGGVELIEDNRSRAEGLPLGLLTNISLFTTFLLERTEAEPAGTDAEYNLFSRMTTRASSYTYYARDLDDWLTQGNVLKLRNLTSPFGDYAPATDFASVVDRLAVSHRDYKQHLAQSLGE